jgi:hypothetical protein
VNGPAPTEYTQCEVSTCRGDPLVPVEAYSYDERIPVDENRCERTVPPVPRFRAVTEPETSTYPAPGAVIVIAAT